MINMQPRKTLLFSNQDPKVEKEESKDFNVPIGCYERTKKAPNLRVQFLEAFLMKIVHC